MTSDELCTKLKAIVQNYKTLYVNGGIGYRLTPSGKSRAYQNKKNCSITRRAKISKADEHTWAFDCNNLVMSVIYGWCGDESKTYGGADYSNPTWYTTESLLGACSDISKNFNIIERGELVWIQGHVGVYIGNGIVVECSPKWKDGVQFSNLGNLPQYKNGNYRLWSKHGKLPFVNYNQSSGSTVVEPKKKSNEQIAKEVIQGKWGNGLDRKKRLTDAGYDYKVIQGLVNSMIKKG